MRPSQARITKQPISQNYVANGKLTGPNGGWTPLEPAAPGAWHMLTQSPLCNLMALVWGTEDRDVSIAMMNVILGAVLGATSSLFAVWLANRFALRREQAQFRRQHALALLATRHERQLQVFAQYLAVSSLLRSSAPYDALELKYATPQDRADAASRLAKRMSAELYGNASFAYGGDVGLWAMEALVDIAMERYVGVRNSGADAADLKVQQAMIDAVMHLETELGLPARTVPLQASVLRVAAGIVLEPVNLTTTMNGQRSSVPGVHAPPPKTVSFSPTMHGMPLRLDGARRSSTPQGPGKGATVSMRKCEKCQAYNAAVQGYCGSCGHPLNEDLIV